MWETRLPLAGAVGGKTLYMIQSWIFETKARSAKESTRTKYTPIYAYFSGPHSHNKEPSLQNTVATFALFKHGSNLHPAFTGRTFTLSFLCRERRA
jgi:hypothetical protein